MTQEQQEDWDALYATHVTPCKLAIVADGPLLDAVVTNGVCPTCGQEFDAPPWRHDLDLSRDDRFGVDGQHD